MTTNKFGLTRKIPAGVQQSVRQRCGFGCVICGNAIYQYDHFDPEFSQAQKHEASGITLLCAACHDRKTRGQLSPETVRAANKSPRPKQQGFSFGPFDIGSTSVPIISIGSLTAQNVRCLVNIYGDDIFSIKPPSSPGLPFRLSAFLCDSAGQETLRIVDNEWRTNAANWDATVEGQRISLRDELGTPTLCLRMDPPHRLVVEHLKMAHRGGVIECTEGSAVTFYSKKTGGTVSIAHSVINGADIGVQINDAGIGVAAGQWIQPPASRNDKCPCGSGKKFKHCHGRA